MPVDAEQELVRAAEAFSAVMTAVESRGRKIKIGGRDVKLLRAELGALGIAAAALLERDLVTDAEMRSVAARYKRVAAALFEMLISVDSDRKM
jgi:hypothetical protein